MEYLKALLAGLIVAVPMGPVFVMVVQRTLCHGRRAGAMVGLGAAAGDAIFAAVGLLTLTLVQQLVADYRGWLLLLGGLLLGLIGFGILRRGGSVELPPDRKDLSGWTCALQAFGSTLSNPGALAAMLAVLAILKVDVQATRLPFLLPAACGLGEWLYWLSLVYLLGRYLRLNPRTLRLLSRIAGVLICVFALVLLVRGILMLTES